jgi:hypothetical protein
MKGVTMPRNEAELTVLNPRGETGGAPLAPPSPRLKDLAGKRIGIIENRIPTGEMLFPLLEKALRERAPATEFRVWDLPISASRENRDARLKEVADDSDGVVLGMTISGGSTTRTTPDAVKIERFGKPVVLIVTRCFKPTARFIARGQGLADLAVVPLLLDYVPPVDEIIKLGIAEKAAEEVVSALTDWTPQPPDIEEVPQRYLTFTGADYPLAVESFEKYFLQHGWSDGLPLVAPTEAAVKRMLEGTELSPDKLIAELPPGGGRATVEKIAINAVMAGCLPQYLPLVLAAVDAIVDPKFDLEGVQCTSGQLAPLLLVSGDKLVKDLNINDSFCTVGPGWRANTSIGRAL